MHHALAAYRRILGYPCGISNISNINKERRFRSSVMIILKNTKTSALHSVQLFGCSCLLSRYKTSMKHMEKFAVKATNVMFAARLGEYVVHGFSCCDS